MKAYHVHGARYESVSQEAQRTPCDGCFFCHFFGFIFVQKVEKLETSSEWFSLLPNFPSMRPLFLSLVGRKLLQAQSNTFASVSISLECIGGRVSCSVFCFRVGRKVTCQDVRQGDGSEGEGVRRRRWGEGVRERVMDAHQGILTGF